ncbi:PREDICTED: protein giant [Ceratosolen solmsi marchali]|uniref:Protein giant n=1 Tax=Ceratosolen solmsi marchali TaxID=326594 RepID=A0AAJ7DWP3_9HYME|nr:PREDICTED: protein giant [Ceratosolen solmsi marchali]
MTKSFKKISMESLHGLDYTNTIVKKPFSEGTETPVLDLSCKKLVSPSLTTNYVKESMVSPLRETIYLESHQETNNNDNKHVNNYQHHRSVEEQDVKQSQQNQTHQYHQEETSSFSSSNHERKSPFESRTYVMTPPSESDSPKKTKFHPIFEHTNLSGGETRVNPPYPILPVNLPSPMSLSVPSVLPALLSQSNSPVVSQIQTPTSSTTHEASPQTNSAPDDSKKAPRPFKAYPKDPLSITLGPDMMFDQELKKAYSDFRNRMLDSVKRTNEGTNIKMRRISKSPMLPTSTVDEKDAAYWERRRKNNEAAKRSRDARRAKEDEIAIRAAFLEQEYIRLKYENAVLKDENTKIKCMLYGC